MASTIITGLQWGDEGKGKITDYYAEDVDYVVRFQGGNNAGHTVIVGDTTFKFHLLPSGVVQGKRCCIGAGVVLDPKILLKELNDLGKEVDLVIDPRTQIIMPYHILLDTLGEGKKGELKIGTTGRGIGPCYSDRCSRIGVRFDELCDEEALKEKLDRVFQLKKRIIEDAYGTKMDFTKEDVFKEYSELGKKLSKYLGDVSLEIHDAIKSKKNVLFEGAQGTFLDNDFGTYPYVTSSHPISAGMFTGVGLGIFNVDRITGIAKAYTTRVGDGPFPTELDGSLGEAIRKKGDEFGTTTGRPRRVGWLDLNILRTAKRLNGYTEIALTKLDVLNGLDELKIATSYEVNGEKTLEFPSNLKDIGAAKVNYEVLKGFDFEEVSNYSDLPKEARDYVEFIEKELDSPVKIVSIGPERTQTLTK